MEIFWDLNENIYIKKKAVWDLNKNRLDLKGNILRLK